MFRKILLCSDGSQGALTAARMGAQIAQRFHSAVLLVHAYDPNIAVYPAVGGGGWEYASGKGLLDKEAEAMQRSMMEHTGRILREANLKYETLLECGHPVDAITRVAKQHDVDLVVMGGRGASDVPAFLLGSVSEGVLHRAHCPVLIVRGDSAAPWQRVLLASDGSDDAGHATATAIGIAQKFAASLRVLNVLEGSSLSMNLTPYPSADSETPYARAESLLAEISADVGGQAREAGVVCSFHQETGSLAESIIAFAERQETGLIVLGCRGRNALTSLLLGSVSNCVAHYAHCSVLVIR